MHFHLKIHEWSQKQTKWLVSSESKKKQKQTLYIYKSKKIYIEWLRCGCPAVFYTLALELKKEGGIKWQGMWETMARGEGNLSRTSGAWFSSSHGTLSQLGMVCTEVRSPPFRSGGRISCIHVVPEKKTKNQAGVNEDAMIAFMQVTFILAFDLGNTSSSCITLNFSKYLSITFAQEPDAQDLNLNAYNRVSGVICSLRRITMQTLSSNANYIAFKGNVLSVHKESNSWLLFVVSSSFNCCTILRRWFV